LHAVLELGIGASAVMLVPAQFGGQPAPPDSTQTSVSLFYLRNAFVLLAVAHHSYGRDVTEVAINLQANIDQLSKL
jgi:hypothetical protein